MFWAQVSVAPTDPVAVHLRVAVNVRTIFPGHDPVAAESELVMSTTALLQVPDLVTVAVSAGSVLPHSIVVSAGHVMDLVQSQKQA
jgi:hypothetical protein